MGKTDISFNTVFRKDMSAIIATNRSSAILMPVRLRYNAAGYPAGQTLARNTTDGLFQKYAPAGSSGTDTAACFLFEGHGTEDFDGANATGTTLAVGIFGGCTLFYSKLADVDSAAVVDVQGRVLTDSTGVVTLKF